MLRVWKRWQAAEEGPNPPLRRSYAGYRDFDVNLDGVAHYGLVPDYIQDVVNSASSPEEVAPLFRGAENFLRMWERAESRARLPR